MRTQGVAAAELLAAIIPALDACNTGDSNVPHIAVELSREAGRLMGIIHAESSLIAERFNNGYDSHQ